MFLILPNSSLTRLVCIALDDENWYDLCEMEESARGIMANDWSIDHVAFHDGPSVTWHALDLAWYEMKTLGGAMLGDVLGSARPAVVDYIPEGPSLDYERCLYCYGDDVLFVTATLDGCPEETTPIAFSELRVLMGEEPFPEEIDFVWLRRLREQIRETRKTIDDTLGEDSCT